MMYDPNKHHRRSIRLPGYDYTLAGAYYVTLCTHERARLLGEIADGVMRLNPCGEIAAATWLWLATRYSWVTLGPSVVMPNHLHGIVIVGDRHEDGAAGAGQGAPVGAAKAKPLGRLMGAFKTVSTKQINLARDMPGAVVWQRSYYEHIVRNDQDWARICHYIEMNPAVWADDPEFL